MRILLLSHYPDNIARILRDAGDVAYMWENAVLPPILDFDWIISYGYRHILHTPVLLGFEGRIINLHIGYLPYNRGADPNFWSWFDGTPKGVTIHQIDEGIDTGPILTRVRLPLEPKLSLRLSYGVLQTAIESLFAGAWPTIRTDKIVPLKNDVHLGTSHKKKDREAIWHHFPLGWDTPCVAVEEFGRKWRQEHGTAARLAGD